MIYIYNNANSYSSFPLNIVPRRIHSNTDQFGYGLLIECCKKVTFAPEWNTTTARLRARKLKVITKRENFRSWLLFYSKNENRKKRLAIPLFAGPCFLSINDEKDAAMIQMMTKWTQHFVHGKIRICLISRPRPIPTITHFYNDAAFEFSLLNGITVQILSKWLISFICLVECWNKKVLLAHSYE